MATNLPYYSMYPKDFDTNEHVLLMEDQELGMYLRCLNKAWTNDGLPAELDELRRLLHESQETFSAKWPRISPCFFLSEDGRLRNKRQEKERAVAIKKVERTTKANETNARNRDVNADVSGSVNASDNAGHVSDSDSNYDSPSLVVSVEESPRETIDGQELVRRWNRHAGFKKLDKQTTAKVILKWDSKPLLMSSDEVDASLDCYLASHWGKCEKFPVWGWLKDPQSWVPEPVDEFVPVVASAPVTTNAVALPECRTIPDFLAQRNNQSLNRIFSAYVNNGMGPKITLPVLTAFWLDLATLEERDQQAMALNAEMSFPKDRGYIKMPKAYFASMPWTAPNVPAQSPPPQQRSGKPDYNAEAREIVRQKMAEQAARKQASL